MYRVYLRSKERAVSCKTVTPSRASALVAFAELVNRQDLDGTALAVALTHANRQVAFHRFDRSPGYTNYWRNRLGEIEWPSN